MLVSEFRLKVFFDTKGVLCISKVNLFVPLRDELKCCFPAHNL